MFDYHYTRRVRRSTLLPMDCPCRRDPHIAPNIIPCTTIRHHNINSRNQYKKSLSCCPRAVPVPRSTIGTQCVYFSGFIFLPRFFLQTVFFPLCLSIYIHNYIYIYRQRGLLSSRTRNFAYGSIQPCVHCPVQRHGISSSGCHDIVCVARTEKRQHSNTTMFVFCVPLLFILILVQAKPLTYYTMHTDYPEFV